MTQNNKQEPVPVFISYSRKDETVKMGARWEERLREQLQPGVDQGLIDLWSDRDIQAGKKWDRQIERQLRRTKVAVLLIGPAFLASAYVRNREMPILSFKATAPHGG